MAMASAPPSPWLASRRRVLGTAAAATLAGSAWAAEPAGSSPANGDAGKAQAPKGRPALPAELAEQLPEAQLLGSAKLRFWGLDIYQARLWAGPDFQAAAYARQPFALELLYFRALRGQLIAERSLKEMRRQASLGQAQEQAWLAAMVQAFPDVRAGDRITGLYRPRAATRFWYNGQSRPGVADADFGPLFFGIWLSEASSEPAMRASLLGQAP